MKTLIGMSGGVDSAVTAALVSKNQDAAGITLRLYDGNNPDLIQKFDREASDAADVCKKLGIGHTTLDLKSDFYQFVIKHFIDEYIAGRTPNPCIQCNIHIKFGAMLDYAKANGFDSIATGHYARVDKLPNGRYAIRNSVTAAKDQTYALYNLTQYQLAHTLMPVGAYPKDEIRKMAEAAGLDENTCAIEIGPGVGVLTAELAKRAGKVLSFELDRRLLPVLKETLEDFNNVEIINV